MSCGSPMPRGEQIAKPTERGIRLSVFFLPGDVMRKSMLLFLPLAVVGACRPPQQSLTEADRSAVAETVKRIVTGVFAAASRRDAAGLVSGFAADPDAHPIVWNGVAQPTIERLRATADSFYGAIAGLESSASGEIRTMVLAPDAAAAEVPFTFTITTKSGKRVPGQGVATALLRKRAGAWKIVHWHESEQHFDAVMQQVFGARH